MRDLSKEEMILVGGGCGDGSCDSDPKGNNGWGNGAEGTNNGSDDGATRVSKTTESGDGGNGNHTAR